MCEKADASVSPNPASRAKYVHRAKRNGVVLARLGRRFNGVYHDVSRLRSAIEKLISNGSEILPLRQRMKIQSICRMETSIRAMEMAIRDDGEMGTAEMRSCRESISRWTVQRDNMLAKLIGDRGEMVSEWDQADEGVEDTNLATEGSVQAESSLIEDEGGGVIGVSVAKPYLAEEGSGNTL